MEGVKGKRMTARTRMKDQIAVVIGAGSGIGAAAARSISENGAHVICCDLNLAGAESVAAEIVASGGKASAMHVDVSDEKGVHAMIEEIIAKHGRIHALANTAGIVGPTEKPAHELAVSSFVSTFSVNFYGAVYTNAAVLPHMIKAGYGRILHVASIAGKEGNPNMAPYVASKAALIGFVKATAREVADKGITINSLAPAITRTPINENTSENALKYMISRIPIGRVGEPAEVGEMIAFAVSPACSFTTGFVFDTSGGRATY